MKQRFVFILGLSVLLILHGFGPHRFAQASEWPQVTLTAHDRILILAPHPDDEVIGCAGVIQKALRLKLPIRIVFFTYGDNNQWSFLVYRKHPVFFPKAVENMGLKRRDEAIAAAKVFGLSESRLTFLGYPDFGTMNIWYSRWGKRPPFRSFLTRARHVPYASAFRPGAPYKGEEILKDLKTIVSEFRPTKIFVSHPTDHNGDHRALYLFLRVALWDLEGMIKPQIYPYLIHVVGWPKTQRHQTEILEPPDPLKFEMQWQTSALNLHEVAKKFMALQAHKSQYQSSKKYLDLFIRPNELFGDFPDVYLQFGNPHRDLSSKGSQKTIETPEELTDIERASFVGVEWRYVWLEDHHLVISIRLSRPLAKGMEASMYIFGYRPDCPFGQMPKLHIRAGVLDYSVFDQNRRLPQETIKIVRLPNEITVHVPLEILGNPKKILTSAKTYLSDIPLDWLSWRILNLPEAETNFSQDNSSNNMSINSTHAVPAH